VIDGVELLAELLELGQDGGERVRGWCHSSDADFETGVR
jgi:hypothetical protein